MNTIIHEFNGLKIKKAVYNTPSFLLSNKKGSFFSLPLSNKPLSRFQGFHLCTSTKSSWEVHKVLENIHPNKTPLKLINKLFGAR